MPIAQEREKTCLHATAPHGSSHPSAAVEGIEPRERRRLIDWLDDGLRAGRRGRLEAEYPLSLDAHTPTSHRVVRAEGVPIAHAMFHVVRVRTPAPLTVGMIGLVYTEPQARGRGLARRCVEACVEATRARGSAVALLWSEKVGFYERLGFRPFGVETHYRVDAALCRRARRELAARDVRVDEVRERDWACLERLYAAKPVFTERPPGSLRLLAAAPDTRVVVARRGRRAVAYAAVGRGDDFRGVAHEWAGSPAGVLACLEALCAEYGSLHWFRGPCPGPLDAALEVAGAPCARVPFALGRMLDPRAALPDSLYLWGFDSI